MSEHIEALIGCDFGAPLAAGDQSKKTIAIEASRTGDGRYKIAPAGRNERLVRKLDRTLGWTNNRRGWTIPGLAASIRDDPKVIVAAFDFPFSIPLDLLQSAAFACKVTAGAFETRANWAQFVKQHLGMAFSSDMATAQLRLDPILRGWKDKSFWIKRATDIATNAQPPLKHMFQNLFNMTVVGSSFLGSLREGGMQILLHPEDREHIPEPPEAHSGNRTPHKQHLGRSVIETYPGAVAMRVGFDGDYKQQPRCCLEAAEEYLRGYGIVLDFDRDVRKFCLEYRTPPDDPDGADAFLCLVTAICFRERLADWHKGGGTVQQLNEEGCIVTPTQLNSCRVGE
jgi:hypothetical protein